MSVAVADLSMWAKWFYYLLLITGVVGSLYFCARYTIVSKWWKSPEGSHLFFFSAAVGSALAYIVARNILGDFPGRVVIGLLIFFLIDVGIIWRVVVFERVRRDVRRSRGE